MNVFLLQGVLQQKYNTHFTELRNKIRSVTQAGASCRTCNPHSSRPVGHSMQTSLKLKLQNAVNQSSFADAPTLIVGGRRRNRKKRRNKNGQAKRKNKKGVEPVTPFVTASITPDFEYYQDYMPQKPIFSRPVKEEQVSCLDIGEPVFVYGPIGKTQIVITNPDSELLHSSDVSSESPTSSRDSGCEQESTSGDESEQTVMAAIQEHDKSTEDTKTIGFPRTHSQDSGVYDDDDDGYEDESTDDAGFVEDIGDNTPSDLSSNEVFSCTLKDELEEAEHNLASPVDTENDSTVDTENDVSKFEEIDLSGTDDLNDTATSNGLLEETVAQNEVRIITDIDQISNKFLTMDDDEDIIFDISQLELNTAKDDISKIGNEKLSLKINEGSLFDPTELEEGSPQRLPMDLLIDDDKDDEVLFDAGARRDLSITCNPLYEHSLLDDEDKLSIKSYQSGFKTNFDSVSYIQIPGTAPTRSQKESSRLLKSQDDDLSCCVIL